MRYFETRAPLPLTAEGFIELRNDVGFDHFCAEWENQILEIELHETEDGSMHRVMSKKMKENPVPALFRSLAPADIEFATEERFDPRRCSVSSPMVITAKLPGSLAEMVSIDSLQWVERGSSEDGSKCVLCSQHEVTARVRGFGSTIEKKLEDKIRASYENIPKQVAAYLVKHGMTSTPPRSSRRSVSERSARHSVEGYGDKVVAVDVRRRVSVVVDDGDGCAQHDTSRHSDGGMQGARRTMSVTTVIHSSRYPRGTPIQMPALLPCCLAASLYLTLAWMRYVRCVRRADGRALRPIAIDLRGGFRAGSRGANLDADHGSSWR